MAEITGRRRGKLVRGVFEVLMDKPDGLPAAQVLKAVEQPVPPSEFERETYPRNPGDLTRLCWSRWSGIRRRSRPRAVGRGD
jgi:hypothetical protein